MIWMILIWAICGFVNYGVWVGTFTKEYPYHPTKTMSTIMALGGISASIVLILSIIFDFKQIGWRLRPLTVEQRWAVFQKEYPSLIRENASAERQSREALYDFDRFKSEY